MKLNFRIDWGYQYLYSRRMYHPIYDWDGQLECSSGTITECGQLNYPVIWFGPGQCAREKPLAGSQWKSLTKRGISGIHVAAEVELESIFTLRTVSGVFSFSAADVLEKGRIRFSVGPKYLGCAVTVTRDGYLWFRPAPPPLETVWDAAALNTVPIHDWARMRTAWIAPGHELSFSGNIPVLQTDFAETVFHLIAMVAPAFTPDHEKQAWGIIPMELLCDGLSVARFSYLFRAHDTYMQILEDVWTRFQSAPGKHIFTLKNLHNSLYLLVNRITMRPSGHNHLDLSLPEWALAGEPLIGRIFAVREEKCTVRTENTETVIPLASGWNDFHFQLSGGEKLQTVEVRSATVPARYAEVTVYDCPEEPIPVKVGYDMTVVPHDSSGFMDWLLDYTWRTRLGNLVVFRPFNKTDETDWKRWGEFCRDHGIYVESAQLNRTLAKSAGPMLHSMGLHEWPGAVYASDPREPYASPDMKTAMEHYLNYLKTEVDKAHAVVPNAAFGDASGGHRYCYMAGADFIRTETMVPHTQHICSQARPAAEVFRNGEWGVHIAIQHCFQPYSETHLGQFFLSMYQPWMMGANMIYEEDSLFLLFKEERQTWDDALTKGKRDMMRNFYRFVKTHPRRGRCQRSIAFLEGRYAAPFNGFICGSEQTPDYSVWGLFGNSAPEWGHRQPEKCRQLLDVLMPGASTQPLNQRFDKRRFFFSGTPFGDFDETPIEASADYLGQYKLLLNLGWNTMIEEDYDKLTDYVHRGGVLLTGIPQFSQHIRRDFLKDMQDLALWNNGDLSDLCGIRVLGPGTPYSGQWNAAGRETFAEPQLSALPNHSPDEDGEARAAAVILEGAEMVAWDAANGTPLLVKKQVDQGWVYTFTLWAYPGHERFQSFCAAWLARLAGETRSEIFVEDESGEVFWTLWRHGETHTLMMLNTDWTCKDNEKPVRIVTPAGVLEREVPERVPVILDF